MAEGLRRLGQADEARALLKSYGEKYGDSVVMDGLIAPNAPRPPAPSPASGIAEILFDIGGIFGGILAGLLSDKTGCSAFTCAGYFILTIPSVMTPGPKSKAKLPK